VASVPVVGMITLVAADVVKVNEWPPLVISDPLSAIVSVAPVPGAVIVTLLKFPVVLTLLSETKKLPTCSPLSMIKFLIAI
jgi:hypothetical protein